MIGASGPSSDELALLAAIVELRATDPKAAEEHERSFKRHMVGKPITEALGDLRESFAPELEAQAKHWGSDVWLDCLLYETIWEARKRGNLDLVRVLTAVKLAAASSNVDGLLTECVGPKTMAGLANKYVEEQGSVLAGMKRPLLLKEISKLFEPEPEPERAAVDRVIARLGRILEFGNAEIVFALPPPSDWEDTVAREVLDLRMRSHAGELEPGHYVRAVLVGLGVDRETAKDWVKGMRK